MATTLAQMRTRVLQSADIENTSFITTAELNTRIQLGYQRLYGRLVNKFEDYFVSDTPTEFTVASGSDSANLPADFFKLVNLDRDYSGRWREVRQYMNVERNYDQRMLIYRSATPRVRYRIFESKIKFVPQENAPGTYRMQYVPQCPTLSIDADTIDILNGWDEWIEMFAAEWCRIKEEADYSDLKARRKEIETAIEEEAANRDIGEPQRVQDVNHFYSDGEFY